MDDDIWVIMGTPISGNLQIIHFSRIFHFKSTMLGELVYESYDYDYDIHVDGRKYASITDACLDHV